MPVPPTVTLGTLLRHLIEMLDGAVEESYVKAGLDYRPRYTPVMRLLIAQGPAPIKAIAAQAGITHSAASQTVSEMAKRGLVEMRRGRDGRERIAALTPVAEAMIPVLGIRWAATNAAARTLDEELSSPLSAVLREAIAVLERRPFGERIEAAAAQLEMSRNQTE